jgi:hypothetical protein
MSKFTKESIGKRFIVKDRLMGINISQVDVLDVREKTYHLKYQHAHTSNWYEKSRFDNDKVVIEYLGDTPIPEAPATPLVKLDSSLRYVRCTDDIDECLAGLIYLRDEKYIILPSGNLLHMTPQVMECFTESSLEEYQEFNSKYNNQWKVGDLTWLSPGKKFLAIIDSISGVKADVSLVRPPHEKITDLWWEEFTRPTYQEAIDYLKSILSIYPLGQKLVCLSTGYEFYYDFNKLTYSHGQLWQYHPEGDNWLVWSSGNFAAPPINDNHPEDALAPEDTHPFSIGSWFKYSGIDTLYGIIKGFSPLGAAVDVDHLNGDTNVLEVSELAHPTYDEINSYLTTLAIDRYPIGSLVKSLISDNPYRSKIMSHDFTYNEDIDTLYVDLPWGSYAIYSNGVWAELGAPFKVGEYIWSGKYKLARGKVIEHIDADWVRVVSSWPDNGIMTWRTNFCIRLTLEELQVNGLLSGNVVKEPTRWTPSHGETYWYFDELFQVRSKVYNFYNSEKHHDNALIRSGNCFKSEEDVTDTINKIVKLIELTWQRTAA